MPNQLPLIEHILLGIAILLLVSIIASKVSARLGIPVLLLFIFVGMLAGSEGIGGIYFDNAYVAQFVGVIALVFILFSGGLDTDWLSFRSALREGMLLSTLGVLITAGIVGIFATAVFGFTIYEGLLLGAIVSSTDAAAVFSLLRGRGARLRDKIEPILETESGSNDPMAIFLTIGMIRLVQTPDLPLTDLLFFFLQQFIIGGLLGIGIGWLMRVALNRVRLEYDGLYPVLTIGGVIFAYSLITALGGNGFLAVYIIGIMLARSDFIHKRSLARFHDGIAWLMQIAMFLVLGLLVFPSQLVPVAGKSILIVLVLIFVARPISVFVSIAWMRMNVRDLLMISWVGLRGAAPIILATFPLLAGVDQANVIFNIVFFVVLTSVAVQGTTLTQVGKLLGVQQREERRGALPLEFVPVKGIQGDMREFTVPMTASCVGRQVVDLNLPKGALIVLLYRDAEYQVPSGSTVIEPGDRLLVLSQQEQLLDIEKILANR